MGISMKCCPTCGRPFPPDVQVGGIVRQQLYNYIARHPEGVTRIQCMEALYTNARNGGPDTLNIINVMVKHINRKLDERGYAWKVKGSGGPGSTYKVIQL